MNPSGRHPLRMKAKAEIITMHCQFIAHPIKICLGIFAGVVQASHLWAPPRLEPHLLVGPAPLASIRIQVGAEPGDFVSSNRRMEGDGCVVDHSLFLRMCFCFHSTLFPWLSSKTPEPIRARRGRAAQEVICSRSPSASGCASIP